MSSAEQLRSIDFSIDPEVVGRAKELLGGFRVSRESAQKWIESPVKEAWERIIFGVFGSLAASPLVLAASGSVFIADGAPTLYRLKVGFLGEGNQIKGLTEIMKIRTFQREVDKRDFKNPFQTTAFLGTRKRPLPTRDPRVHSSLGAWLRRIALDELPQLLSILKGRMAGIGPRAYTLAELRGLQILFQLQDESGNVFPEGFPEDYREVISHLQPKPGLVSLYSAIYRKQLTVSERLLLDYLYLTCANPLGDLRILKATFETSLKGTGAW